MSRVLSNQHYKHSTNQKLRSWANAVFQNRGVCGQTFPSFPSPSPVIPFFALFPTFSTNSRGNACYAGHLFRGPVVWNWIDKTRSPWPRLLITLLKNMRTLIILKEFLRNLPTKQHWRRFLFQPLDVRGGWLPPPLKVFLSFFPEDKTSAPDFFSSCSFIPRAHVNFVTSSVMISCYGYDIWRHK